MTVSVAKHAVNAPSVASAEISRLCEKMSAMLAWDRLSSMSAGTPMWKATRFSTMRPLSPRTPARPTMAPTATITPMTAKASSTASMSDYTSTFWGSLT